MRLARLSNDVLVLCYHAVSPDWPADLSLTPARLGEQLALLAARGYRGVTFSDAVRNAPAGRHAAITFDDGYLSVLERARPILERHGFVGTVFAVTNCVGKGGPMAWAGIDRWVGSPYEHELAGMNWSQLGELADAGWEVGSHTRTHPYLPQVSDAQLVDELVASRHAMEENLGRVCRSIAYPYGHTDARVIAATRDAGYVAAAGLPARIGANDPYNWPRPGIYNTDHRRRFQIKVSPAVRRLRRALNR